VELLMADTWSDWTWGSPDRRLEDLEYQRAKWNEKTSSPFYQAFRSMHDEPIWDKERGVTVDPRALRMEMVMDELSPRRSSDAFDAEAAVSDYALAFGQRMRDTGLRAVQEANSGNYGNALGLAMRTPVAGLAPMAAAGTPGSPDDWRPRAAKNGVSPTSIMAFDLLTDPETWITAPVAGPLGYVAPVMPLKMAGAVANRADDVLRLLGRTGDAAAYGRGAPTYLVDEAGETIRRLRNSPAAMAQ
jgi:hypothetical protein